MWIFTPIGYFSIVKKEYDAEGEVTVRARLRQDLEALKKYVPSMSEVKESDRADYRYRTTANQEDVASALGQLTREINYPNFKNEVTAVQGYERANLYEEVWYVMRNLQRPSNSNEMIERAKDLAYTMISTGEGSEIAKDNVFDYVWAFTGLEVDARESARNIAEKIVTEMEGEYRKYAGG